MSEETKFDWVLRNARLPGATELCDLGIRDGIFVAIEKEIRGEFPDEIDCNGHLLVPPFVDSHFHLDSVLSLPETGENQSGTLLEGIELWRRHKQTLTAERIYERAEEYCKMAMQNGLLHIRSHVDVSHPDLAGVHALTKLRDAWRGVVDIQLVAFPQDGALRNPQAMELIKKSLDLGVDIVGGIPHFERTYAEGEESIDQLCRLAADHGAPVDMHCDETDDARSRHVETLAACAVKYGLQGRVAASHTTSLHSVDDPFFQKLTALLVEAEVSVIANPLINITLQGRFDGYPKRRGVTRIPELLAAGVNVAAGHDCVMDPWYALGSGDMLEVAHMAFHVCHMTGSKDLPALLDLVTTNAAKAVGLPDYGIATGKSADFVLLECTSVLDAIRLRPRRLVVGRIGKIVHQVEFDATQEPAGD